MPGDTMTYRVPFAVLALVIAGCFAIAQAQPPAPVPPPASGIVSGGQLPPPPPSPDAVARELCTMGRAKSDADAAAIISQNLRALQEQAARIVALEAEVARLKAAAAPAAAAPANLPTPAPAVGPAAR